MQIAGVRGLPEFDEHIDLAGVLVPALQALNWPDGSTGVQDADIPGHQFEGREQGRRAMGGRPGSGRHRRHGTGGGDSRTAADRGEPPRGGMASAGVDRSNTTRPLRLPRDPDASAATLRERLSAALGVTSRS